MLDHRLGFYDDRINHKRIFVCECKTEKFQKFITHIDLRLIKSPAELQRIFDLITVAHNEHLEEIQNGKA